MSEKQTDSHSELPTWCPQCGPHVRCEEDGCCATCGCDCTGDGADMALAALACAGQHPPSSRCGGCARLLAENKELQAMVISKQNALNLAVKYREAAEAESERLLAKVVAYEEMMESCFCDLYADASGDGEPIERYEAKRLTTRKAHACEECGDVITVGAHAERVTGLWDGRKICWYTCEVCLRIRDDLMGGCFMHGTMREDIKMCLGIDYVSGEIDESWIEG